jgi:type IX secretion system PorP/SprF family membrane protein
MKKILTICFCFLGILVCRAQDLHLTQFVNNPQMYAPAMAGHSGGDLRALVTYRAQWQRVPVPYRTISTAADALLGLELPLGMQLGTGMLLHADEAGDGRLRTVQPALGGALHLPLGAQMQLSFGMQTGLLHRSVDFSGLRFEEQYDGDLYQPGAPTGEPFDMASINQLTLAGGLNFHTQVAYSRTALNVGIGAFHLNQPASSFYGDDETRMPRRFSFYAEGTIQLSEQLDLAIHSLFQQQQDYQELLYGLLLRYYLVPDGPFLRSVGLGAYFRHGDALAPMLEVQQGPWRVAFSYDINLSAFQVATLGRGGPELHLRYLLIRVKPPGPPKICPVF